MTLLAPETVDVALRDGATVRVRPMRAEDAEGLRTLSDDLSAGAADPPRPYPSLDR